MVTMVWTIKQSFMLQPQGCGVRGLFLLLQSNVMRRQLWDPLSDLGVYCVVRVDLESYY